MYYSRLRKKLIFVFFDFLQNFWAKSQWTKTDPFRGPEPPSICDLGALQVVAGETFDSDAFKEQKIADFSAVLPKKSRFSDAVEIDQKSRVGVHNILGKILEKTKSA